MSLDKNQCFILNVKLDLTSKKVQTFTERDHWGCPDIISIALWSLKRALDNIDPERQTNKVFALLGILLKQKKLKYRDIWLRHLVRLPDGQTSRGGDLMWPVSGVTGWDIRKKIMNMNNTAPEYRSIQDPGDTDRRLLHGTFNFYNAS